MFSVRLSDTCGASRRQLLLTASIATLLMAAPAEAQQSAVSAWEGFYVGVHGGYGGGDTDSSSEIAGPLGSYTAEGGFGGAQIGYNWELAGFLVGLEGDISFADIDGDSIFGAKNPSSELDWMATARARIGVLLTPQILAYATGGVAWGEWDDQLAPMTRLGGSDVSIGWTIGGGFETKLTDSVTVKLEYLYIDFGDESYRFTFDSVTADADFDHELHTVKVGLNIKLN